MQFLHYMVRLLKAIFLTFIFLENYLSMIPRWGVLVDGNQIMTVQNFLGVVSLFYDLLSRSGIRYLL